jgi:hypothetical protein
MTLITVCEYADGWFPRRTKNSGFPVVPPVCFWADWEVHPGGFRPPANNRVDHRLNDEPDTYGITYAANGVING